MLIGVHRNDKCHRRRQRVILSLVNNKTSFMATKIKTPIHCAIWIDHKKAIIVKREGAAFMAAEVLLSDSASHERFKGEGSTKTGLFGTTLNSKEKEQHREHEIMGHFYKKVISHIPATVAFLLLAGPAEAKYELHKVLGKKKSLSHVPMEIKTTGKIKAEELGTLLQERMKVKVL